MLQMIGLPSFKDVDKSCFQSLCTVNNSSKNMVVQIPLQDPVFNSLDIDPEMEFLDHMAVLSLIY